jgi:release factor glutamine methyltransferase
VARRARREPLAYIIGRKEFYSIELEVTPAVLIPRPETETVVACALEFLTARPYSRVLDIGTGSGAIALALALNAPHAQIVASDISAAALEVASRNVNRLTEGVNATAPDEPSRSFNGSRITIRRADCFTVLDAGPPLGRFDLIVSNPPYIHREEIDCLQPEVSAYEPRVALCGGADGMDFYRRIAAQAAGHLVAGGAVVVEIADHQSDAVARLFTDAAVTSVSPVRDLGGTPRVIRAEWPTVRSAADRSWKK